MITTFIGFAGVMLGISNMISVVPGFISPVIVGYLTYENVSNKFSFFLLNSEIPNGNSIWHFLSLVTAFTNNTYLWGHEEHSDGLPVYYQK